MAQNIEDGDESGTASCGIGEGKRVTCTEIIESEESGDGNRKIGEDADSALYLHFFQGAGERRAKIAESVKSKDKDEDGHDGRGFGDICKIGEENYNSQSENQKKYELDEEGGGKIPVFEFGVARGFFGNERIDADIGEDGEECGDAQGIGKCSPAAGA